MSLLTVGRREKTSILFLVTNLKSLICEMCSVYRSERVMNTENLPPRLPDLHTHSVTLYYLWKNFYDTAWISE